MNASAPHFTYQEFQDAHADAKAGLNHAEIHYTLNNQNHSFTTAGVSGGLSQTLIAEGSGVALGWKYPGGLQPGHNHFPFTQLLSAVFYSSAFDAYTQVLAGTLDVQVNIIGEGDEEVAEITGTIRQAVLSNGADQVVVNGEFKKFFP
ncbi:hypothetical protein IB241_19470 [Pseudomonas sp. PDM05]|jgi:hypothetical protein|uniref:hypothetical protein n=1 Tax=Pseudomonas sp. PDM05 TaxID=2769301 RepID=UPI0017824496|nr:hypothetical protein [Pseudomonas sp. PDM05]MBD9459870.1 hypothetical protein [Pseudomonas sp. PDM05]